ncbi:MAG: sigma-70 family RNA polymerase sigma factor [Chitinophagaceae bacterium]|nr:sigma-70 family RNA polymerase sigma factor [Chitinophagaceae bacterium]
MENIDDQVYINRVLDGDTQAFSMLVNRYKDMVFSLSLKLIRNREEAEEAAQDSFVKVFRSLNKFKGDSKFSTWLYKVTYNTGLDQVKKNKRTQPVLAIDEYTEAEVKELSSFIDRIEESERKQVIQNCLDQLPNEDNFLLTLFYFEEQSVKEIAKIMGINDNHVKIKLHRGRKKLATVIKHSMTPEIENHYESEHR